MATAHPLQWPIGRPRWSSYRQSSKFKMSEHQMTEHLFRELELLKASDIVVSTNRQPYSRSKTQPDDPGVAVYFKRKGKEVCVACDKWNRVEDNLHAIGLNLEALRNLERWGTSDMVDAAFTGFTALPESTSTQQYGWWQVLGVDRNATKEQIKAAFKELSKYRHPDSDTGSDDKFIALKRAYEEGMTA